MPATARMTDTTSHGSPLGPGTGSTNVLIGLQPAWRAVPAALAASIDAVAGAMKSFMARPMLTPADAAADLADISLNLTKVSARAASVGATGVPLTAATQVSALNATNATLTAAWTSASAVPGGLPAASVAYMQGIKVAAAAAATSVMSAMSGIADMHVCPNPTPAPPHGLGFVTRGSNTVMINNLPAARMGDKVMEACGGADPIAAGCSTVDIGDLG